LNLEVRGCQLKVEGYRLKVESPMSDSINFEHST